MEDVGTSSPSGAGAADPWGEEIDDQILLDACEMSSEGIPPLDRWRQGYLWVSDLSNQLWCEKQAEFRISSKEAPIHPPHVEVGSELHLQRELEIESDYVDVTVTSDEDIFAVKLLNLLHAVEGLASGSQLVHREVPIFGILGTGDLATMFMGKIDEVSLSEPGGTLTLSEFKTRTRRALPGASQKLTHRVQVAAYKALWDSLVLGTFDQREVFRKLRLDPTMSLGTGIQGHCRRLGPSRDHGSNRRSGQQPAITSLEGLMARLQERVKFLPVVGRMSINYTFQGDGQCFAVEDIPHVQGWLEGKVDECLQYWLGIRPAAVGVDVEEAWKCSACQYADLCQWRIRRARELQDSKVSQSNLS